MTMTTTWDVFEDLRNAQDELLRMTRMPGQWLAQLGPQSGSGYASPAWAPAVDITEREDTYLVTDEGDLAPVTRAPAWPAEPDDSRRPARPGVLEVGT